MHGLTQTAATSFNGAATCSLRNADRLAYDCIASWSLQWGRNLFVAECPTACAWGGRIWTCFNGAATCSLRNGGTRPLGKARHRDASMGPQLVRCGMYPIHLNQLHHNISFNGAATCSLRNADLASCVWQHTRMLQWGRNLFVAEWPPAGSPTAPQRRFNGAATCSLRNVDAQGNHLIPESLLQWGRNLFVAECVQEAVCRVRDVLASMGPQLVRCGMTGLVPKVEIDVTPLQWGRNLFVAECARTVKQPEHNRQGLQWGRNLFVAECWKINGVSRRYLSLQWGRNLFVAECLT